MKKKRLLYLILPILTLLFEILPWGAVCNFANPEGEPLRMTYSYFSLTPFGYANFAPFLTALSTCVLLFILIFCCFAEKEMPLKAARITSGVTLALSLCPFLYGLSYYSVLGGLITFSLAAELLWLCLTREKEASL